MSTLTSPAAALALAAALAVVPATGFVTWPSLARGRVASTLGLALAVALFVFLLARRLGFGGGG